MNENMNPENMLPEDEIPILTLFDEEGRGTRFESVATVEYGGRLYEILAPLEPMIGIEFEDGEALVYELSENEGGVSFSLVTDDDVIDAVFAEYDRLWEEEGEE